MNRQRAKDSIDKAADDDVGKLFDFMRTNELGEARDLAVEQFTNGMKKLNDDIAQAKAIIDTIFPE